MDTPDDKPWDELKAFAADRAGWRPRVRAFRTNQVSAVTITINPALPGTHNYSTRSKAPRTTNTQPTSSTNTSSPSKIMASKYRNRDAHVCYVLRWQFQGPHQTKARHQSKEEKNLADDTTTPASCPRALREAPWYRHPKPLSSSHPHTHHPRTPQHDTLHPNTINSKYTSPPTQ